MCKTKKEKALYWVECVEWVEFGGGSENRQRESEKSIGKEKAPSKRKAPCYN